MGSWSCLPRRPREPSIGSNLILDVPFMQHFNDLVIILTGGLSRAHERGGKNIVCTNYELERKNCLGGRWSQETTTFLRLLAQAKARTIPARLKASFTNALIHRWFAQIIHAAMTAYAASLLEFDCVASTVTDGNQPLTSEVLAEATLPALRSSGLDLALFPCTSGAAGI